MIDETQTPNDDFYEITQWQNNDQLRAEAATRARGLFIDEHEVVKKEKTVTSRGVKTAERLAVAGLAASLVVGVAHEARSQSAPEFSHQTKEYAVQPGDGLQDAAEAVTGSDTIDIRDAIHEIQVDPANIPVLQDGLQPGETLQIPDHVDK